MTQPIPGPKEHTPEWLDLHEKYDPDRERPVVFGASQAAAACGQSTYDGSTPLDLYLRYTGKVEPKERKEDIVKRLRRGRRWQEVILREYGEEKNFSPYSPERIFFHPTHSFMAASPDAMGPDENTGLDGLVIEIKASDPRMFVKSGDDDRKYGQEGTDYVPVDVLFQAQQQMAVMDVPRCDVVVFFGLFVMKVYPVERNDTIIEAIVSAEKELAERIVNGDPPEPTWTNSGTKRLLTEMYGYRPGEGAILFKRHQELAMELAKTKAEIKLLEGQRDELNNRLLEALEGAEYGELPNGRRIKRIRVKETVVPAHTRSGYEFLKETKGKH